MPHIVLEARYVDADHSCLSELTLVESRDVYFCEFVRDSTPMPPFARTLQHGRRSEGRVLRDAVAWVGQRIAADGGRPAVIAAFGAGEQRAALEAALARNGVALPADTNWACLDQMSRARYGTAPEQSLHWQMACLEGSTLDIARGWAAEYAEWQEEAEREEALRSVHEAEIAEINEARAAFAEAEVNAEQLPVTAADDIDALADGADVGTNPTSSLRPAMEFGLRPAMEEEFNDCLASRSVQVVGPTECPKMAVDD